LVKTAPPQQVPDSRNAWVAGELVGGRSIRGGARQRALDEGRDVLTMWRRIDVRVHRAELEHGKRLAALAHPLLAKQDGSRRATENADRARHEHRQEANE